MNKFILTLYCAFSLTYVLPSLWSLTLAETINYEGSSTIAKFLSDASSVYKNNLFEKNTDSESLGGLRCASTGSCELGGVANAIDDDDKKNVQVFLIGHDAIAIIVNNRNKLNNLSKQQIQDLFSGKIGNWSEIGGNDWPVNVYTVQDSSATRHVFKKKIMDNKDYAGTEVVIPDRRIISKVVHDWGGIGQISFAFLHNQKGVKPLSVDGHRASVNNPDYPITRPLNLVTHGQPKPKVQDFIDWSLSKVGQDILKKRFVGK